MIGALVNTLKVASLFITLTISSYSFGDRSVSIATPDGKLELINGSSVTVTYTAECYDKVTGSNLLTSASSVTLEAKKHVIYESSGTCANGQTPSYKSSQGPFACSGSNVTFSNAASLCGTSANLCTIATLNTAGISDLSGFPASYWFSSGTTTWYYTYDNWISSYPQTESGGKKNNAPISYGSKSNNYRCNTSASSTNSISYCYTAYASNNYNGAICCPLNNGFKSCKVTVLSATPTKGTLQSPQFKGGTSF